MIETCAVCTLRLITGLCKICAAVTAMVLTCAVPPAIGGDADIVAANAVRATDGTWTFTVTI